MRIGIIGAGKVGTTLGAGWARAGHEVVYGSREPGGAPPHAGSSVASIRDAASADVVVLATPWAAVPDALAAAGDLSGRVLIDVTNPLGPGFKLTHAHSTSGAEEVARLSPGARVVKAFNTTGLENMADPRYGERAAVMFIAGDDPAARAVVLKLATDLGFEAVPIGALSRARQLEPLGLLWIQQALVYGQGRNFAFGVVRRHGAEPEFSRRAPTQRNITIVGAGHIGGALARGWLRAGHQVRLAVRDAAAADVQALVAAGAQAVPVENAADGAEVITLALPFDAAADALGRLGDLTGRVVVDCTNAVGPGLTLRYGGDSSGVEELAKRAPGARLVKSFNQQGAEVLAAPRFDGVPAINFVAGDDPEARRVVAELGEDLGLSCLSSGPLASARLLEAMTLVWIAASQPLGTRSFGLTLLRR